MSRSSRLATMLTTIVLVIPCATHPACAAAVSPAANAPPLDISADNMTGTHGPEGDIVLLNGNVRIRRRHGVLTADHGRYVRSEGMVYLESNVKMVDSTTTLTCDHASYSETSDFLKVDGNVRVVDQDATLEAPWATYDRARGRAELYGGVHARDRDQKMEADSATYLRDSLLLKARGNVHGIDDKNRVEVLGKAADYYRGDHMAYIYGEPRLVSHEQGGTITTIYARRLEVNTETRVAQAIDSVFVVRDTLRARGDYGRFDDRANYGYLVGNPKAWDGETTVTGDTLEFYSSTTELERVVVKHHALMNYLGNGPQTKGEANRLQGERVDVYFTDNEIDSLVAVGGARNDYNAVPRVGKTPERNEAIGDTITVFFEDRKVDRARVEGKASGRYDFAMDVGDTANAADERVQYDARKMEYQVSRNRIVLDPDAHLTYRALELNARRVEFDLKKQSLVAEGNPILNDNNDKVTGHLMSYDLHSKVGTIYKAETEYESGLYHGETIRKVSEKELDVMNGSYSTCDLPQPHYRFGSHWMKIYLKDKMIAKPVVFYIERVPLLALPFWVFPIKPGRHSGFIFPQTELGFANNTGTFIRNAGYYWAPNDYMDLLVAGDYYQADPSWVLRTEGNYKLLYVLEGSFEGSYAKNQGLGEEGWDLDADHTQDLSPRTRLVGRASFVSSKQYSTTDIYGRPLAQRLNRFLTSSLAISHAADWANFNGFFERREDLDADDDLQDPDGPGPGTSKPVGTFASLPNLSLSLPSLTVVFPARTAGSFGVFKGTPWQKRLASLYLNANARFLSTSERRGFVESKVPFSADSTQDSILVIGEQRTDRRGFQSDFSVADARTAFGWLNLRPNLNGTVAVFDHDELGHDLVPTGAWSASLGASATYYGTFSPRKGFLEAFRHVLFPNATLFYSPPFNSLTYVDSTGIRRDRFRSFGSISVSGVEQFRLNLGLDQRLQAKVRRKSEIQRIDNLLSWSLVSSYNFLYKSQGLAHPLSPILSSIQIQPPRNFGASVGWVTDPYQAKPVRSLNYNIGLNLSSTEERRTEAPDLAVDRTSRGVETYHDQWNFALAYSHAGGYSGPTWITTKSLNVVGSYQLSPGWGAEYSASYDVTHHQLGTQRFQLTRDLHCWVASFTRTFNGDGTAEYYFRLGIKQQPEVYIDRGTRAGSIGGIR